MGRISIFLLFAIIAVPGFGQKEEAMYNERAKEIKREIWGDTSAAFQVKQTPVQYNDESAIVIANTYEIINSTASKHRSLIGELQKLSYEVTFRQRVKINDKSAVENYSSIEYKKKLDTGFSFIFSRIKNKMTSYIGAKVIKPDGTEKIINSEEEVLTKNENNNREAKLAISGLQVGDILDFYVRAEILMETPIAMIGPFTFFLNEKYPMLFCLIKIRLDSETGVEYVSANGAPYLKESKDENGDINLELTQTNLPKYSSSVFTSPFRQYPYIKLQFQRAIRGNLYADLNRGDVQQGSQTADVVNRLIKEIDGLLNTQKYYPLILTQNYFGGAEKMKDVSKDSIVKVLYNAWHYSRIFELLKNSAYTPDDIKYSHTLSLENAVYFSRMLSALDIDNTIYLVCSRNSGSLQNVLNIKDFDALLKVNANKYYWLAFDDIFTQLNEIPMRFQGEEAITLRPEKISQIVDYTAGKGKVPVTIPEYNSISENLDVSFDLTNMNVLQVTRTCRQTGSLRHDFQRKLLLTEDVKENIAATIAKNNKLEEKLSDDRKSQLSTAFNTERNNLKTSFEEEISHHFNASPKNLNSYEITQPGLDNYGIPFEYRSSFDIENFARKAGSNYIIEVGKLIGETLQVEEKDRSRNIDVFLSCPLTFNWVININIPPGYDAKGVEELNKIINNETGSFSCTAKSEGHSVNIQIKVVHNNNFEKASGWSQLLEIIDALNNMHTQKILLEQSK